jgi:enhancing lycopene biosynthesis protein 2
VKAVASAPDQTSGGAIKSPGTDTIQVRNCCKVLRTPCSVRIRTLADAAAGMEDLISETGVCQRSVPWLAAPQIRSSNT